MRRRIDAALILVLLGVALTGPAVGADGQHTNWHAETGVEPTPTIQQSAVPKRATAGLAAELSPGPDTRDSAVLNVSYTYRRLPEQPAVVEVAMHIPAATAVDRAVVRFRDDVSVVSTERVAGGASGYEWDGDSEAELVYRLPVDWTYTGNSADSWALLEHRSPSIGVESTVTVSEQIEAEDGYVGNRTLLVGAYDVYTRQVEGERLDLVVPAGVELLYGPNRTVDALARASRSLHIGGRSPVVHAFATPEIESEAVPFPQPGFSLDDRTLLVDADSEMDVWTHEYVHTRQAFARTEGLKWLVEGSAEYYGWLLSIEQGYDGWTELQQVFQQARNDNSVLSDPESWSGEVDYIKGGHVLAVVDREIRAATNGRQTLDDALRNVNGENATVNALLASVREVGGQSVAEVAQRYITTEAAPSYQPDAARLAAVYGYGAPQIRVETRNPSVIGPNWTRSLDPQQRRLQIGLNETVQMTAEITNEGSVPGVVAAAPRISAKENDLDRVDEYWVGRVGPGERVVRSVIHQFNRTGEYEIDRRGLVYAVEVIPARGTASVTDLTVTETASADDQITVEARVRNSGPRDTFVTLPVLLDGQRIGTTALVLDENANRSVIVQRNVSVQTPVSVSVGAASTTVGRPSGAGTPGPEATPATETDPDTESTGVVPAAVVVALVGIVAILGITLRRRRDSSRKSR